MSFSASAMASNVGGMDAELRTFAAQASWSFTAWDVGSVQPRPCTQLRHALILAYGDVPAGLTSSPRLGSTPVEIKVVI
jgi:hypothetical protein